VIQKFPDTAQSGAAGEITLSIADLEPDSTIMVIGLKNYFWYWYWSKLDVCIFIFNKTASIYTTADQTKVFLNSPTPVEGLD
jgi:hypothetical protein